MVCYFESVYKQKTLDKIKMIGARPIDKFKRKEKKKMQKRINRDNPNKLYVDINELCDILSVGRNTALKIAEQSGASVKFGKRHLYSVESIKLYMSSLHNARV